MICMRTYSLFAMSRLARFSLKPGSHSLDHKVFYPSGSWPFGSVIDFNAQLIALAMASPWRSHDKIDRRSSAIGDLREYIQCGAGSISIASDHHDRALSCQRSLGRGGAHCRGANADIPRTARCVENVTGAGGTIALTRV